MAEALQLGINETTAQYPHILLQLDIQEMDEGVVCCMVLALCSSDVLGIWSAKPPRHILDEDGCQQPMRLFSQCQGWCFVHWAHLRGCSEVWHDTHSGWYITPGICDWKTGTICPTFLESVLLNCHLCKGITRSFKVMKWPGHVFGQL